jgi:hypothetical protein
VPGAQTRLDYGGEGGIRTPGARKGSLAFEASAIDHSATSPLCCHLLIRLGKQSECQMSVPLEAPHHADGFSPLGTGLNNFRHSLRITHCRLARRMQRRHCPGASWSNLFTDFPRRCTRKPHSFARGFARPCLFCQFRRVIVEDILLAAMARCVVVRLSRRS